MISRERLERILKLRKTGEAGAKGEWSRARLKNARVKAEAQGLSSRREEAAEEVRSRAQGTVNSSLLMLASEAREAMGRDVDRAEAAALQSEAEAEIRRRELESAHRAVRVIRNLIDRGRAADEAIERAAEARERDDRRLP